jgi:hypothetical protein
MMSGSIVADPVETSIWRGACRQAADYLALTKPRVVLMVLITTFVGFYLGSRGHRGTKSRPLMYDRRGSPEEGKEFYNEGATDVRRSTASANSCRAGAMETS